MSFNIEGEMINDQKLIKLFQKGDNSAYDRLVWKYLHNTIGFFYTLTGYRMMTEDLAQYAFIKLILIFMIQSLILISEKSNIS